MGGHDRRYGASSPAANRRKPRRDPRHPRPVPMVFLLLAASSLSAARQAIEVENISNPAGVRISISPKSSAGWSVLEVVQPKTGICLKTIHAGRFPAGNAFAVVATETLPPG